MQVGAAHTAASSTDGFNSKYAVGGSFRHVVSCSYVPLLAHGLHGPKGDSLKQRGQGGSLPPLSAYEPLSVGHSCQPCRSHICSLALCTRAMDW